MLGCHGRKRLINLSPAKCWRWADLVRCWNATDTQQNSFCTWRLSAFLKPPANSWRRPPKDRSMCRNSEVGAATCKTPFWLRWLENHLRLMLRKPMMTFWPLECWKRLHDAQLARLLFQKCSISNTTNSAPDSEKVEGIVRSLFLTQLPQLQNSSLCVFAIQGSSTAEESLLFLREPLWLEENGDTTMADPAVGSNE